MRKTAKKTTALAKISRIYQLVEEMNVLVSELKTVGVEVQCGSLSRHDPLGQMANIRITLNTEFQSLNG